MHLKAFEWFKKIGNYLRAQENLKLLINQNAGNYNFREIKGDYF
jgi:hypothetical protein